MKYRLFGKSGLRVAQAKRHLSELMPVLLFC
jgi:hypothetical protein